MIKSLRKNVAEPAGVEPATSWSPVGLASNWGTEAGHDNMHKPVCKSAVSYTAQQNN